MTKIDILCLCLVPCSGVKLRSFGTRGSGCGQFDEPCVVAVDGEGTHEREVLECVPEREVLECVPEREVLECVPEREVLECVPPPSPTLTVVWHCRGPFTFLWGGSKRLATLYQATQTEYCTCTYIASLLFSPGPSPSM